MALTPDLVRAINAYLNTKEATTQRVIRYIESQWLRLSSWKDADILRFAKQVAPVVEGGQTQIGNLTAGYLSTLNLIATGSRDTVGIPKQAMSSQSLRGVEGVELFQRTGSTIYFGLSQGKPLNMLVAKAGQRAISMARTNLQLSSTHSARIAMSDNQNIIGYRRVLSGEVCEICELASEHKYNTEDLMPIHNNCTCGIAPIYGNSDPAKVIDSKVESSDNRAEDGIEVHEHGEVGPVLAIKGQHFTGSDDV